MPLRVEEVRFLNEVARLREESGLSCCWKRGSRKRRSLAEMGGVEGAESSSGGGVALVKLRLKGRRGTGRWMRGPGSPSLEGLSMVVVVLFVVLRSGVLMMDR